MPRVAKFTGVVLVFACLGYCSGICAVRTGLAGGVLLVVFSSAHAMLVTAVSFSDFVAVPEKATWWLWPTPILVMMITFLWETRHRLATADDIAFLLVVCLVPAVIARLVALGIVNHILRDNG